jgi:hypothetical protein
LKLISELKLYYPFHSLRKKGVTDVMYQIAS